MTNYGDVYADYSDNKEFAEKIDKIKNVLHKHIGYLKDEDKIPFRKKVELVDYVLDLIYQKNCENINIKSELDNLGKSYSKNFWKKIIAIVLIFFLLDFLNINDLYNKFISLFIIGYFIFSNIDFSSVRRYAEKSIEVNLDYCNLLRKDLIMNGITENVSNAYMTKKKNFEDVHLTGQLRELAVLEYEYHSYLRQMIILSTNFVFKTDDDFYEF
ncbi:MAG: hypothetical protein KGI88_05140 [Betaproteobacteria bacterium]|nr:hypothetical protein [Betaproteobacteria bacterium]